MNIDTYNLETARPAPENMGVRPSTEGGYAMVVSADSPAVIYVDTPSGDPVPAVPGLVLRDFNNLYLQNAVGAGKLRVVFYKCGNPGAPFEIPYFPVLGYAVNNVAAPSVQLPVPGPDWSVVIAAVTFSLSDVGTNPATISANTPAVPTGFVIRNTFYLPDGPSSLHVPFPKPLAFGPGRDVRVTGPRGTATPSTVSVQGAFIR